MYKSGDVSQFKHLSQFNSLQNFNNNIEMHLADHKKQFTKKELIILKRLIRYSAKVPGVSNVSIRRLIQAVEQHDNTTVSEATFHRMKRKAVKLGLLTIHATNRTDNSQSSNLYVFNAYSTSKVTNDSTKNDIPCNDIKQQGTAVEQQSRKSKMTSLEADKNYKTNIINNSRKGDVKFDAGVLKITSTNDFDHTFVSSNVPKKLVDAIVPFYPKMSDVYAIYKRLKLATREYPDSLIYNLDDYIKCFKETIVRLKRGIIRGEYLGYLFGAFKNKAHELKHTYHMPEDSVYFDWVNG
ncbi:hypothetical protein [Pseudogracilibacillus sp. SO30301A]|uniref:hypothetical protein n=1 Tax=Pseudogracilibacillus sp. SO30301A TaxID=3098291 RepID=UPI00300E2E20